MKKKSHKELIKQADANIKKARKVQKDRMTEKLDYFVYWTSLASLALFNLIGCFFLIPFLMFFDGFSLYLAVGGFGFMFGFLFNLLIIGIEHLKYRHHIIAGIFIPLLAVVDIVLILRISERISVIMKQAIQYDISKVVIVFIALFILPYILSVVSGRHKF